jgi:hypothetical protein
MTLVMIADSGVKDAPATAVVKFALMSSVRGAVVSAVNASDGVGKSSTGVLVVTVSIAKPATVYDAVAPAAE